MPPRVKRMAMAAACAMIVVHTASAADVPDGTKLYVDFCQGCHGAEKLGIGQYAGSIEDFQRILEGETTQQMPDFFGVFNESEVQDLFAYLSQPAG